ncbi:MAG: polyphosphate kinase 2 [Anaerolineae bacterium]
MGSKKSKKSKKGDEDPTADLRSRVEAVSTVQQTRAQAIADMPKMGKKEFERELRDLQVELVQLQEWVTREGKKIVIVFEGRDTAGKGGVIKRIVERVSPRVFKVVALSAPTEREQSQIYFQRYIEHMPAAGEVVIFDRSWYNRAGVEIVMGFCTPEQHKQFLRDTPGVERFVVDSGIVLLKYWLEVSEEEQRRRLKARIHDGRKTWKLSPIDIESAGRYYDYSRARDAMFAATDTRTAPWYVVVSEDQRRGRLNCIAHLLSQIPYVPEPKEDVKLPDPQPKGDYEPPNWPFRLVPPIY